MDNLQAEIQKWYCTDGPRNKWFYADFGQVYLRKGAHLINGKIKETLDLASIEIYPEYQRQGYFKRILAFTEQLAQPNRIVYVESVLNPDLRAFLERIAYNKYEDFGNCANYFK